MFSAIAEKLYDAQFVYALLAGIGTVATILTVALPLLESDNLSKRMNAVSAERSNLRVRERTKLNTQKLSLRSASSKGVYKELVEKFDLAKYFGLQDGKMQLARAGYRTPKAEYTFLVMRVALAGGCFLIGNFYAFILMSGEQSVAVKFGIGVFSALVGMKLPEMYLKNITEKRQFSMRQAFPDALDLLLICVESGMSIEPAFKKVGAEIGAQSIPLAEEFGLVTAELSFLPERRTAYENFAARTGLDAVKQITTVLIQAERYGTPMGTALRVVAQESRDNRMMEAEKKAASLPPKLTVPMILFFLPVLFAVIITPAALQISSMK
ncbi:MAG: type secretion system family protein [Hyphomicrobiales bacterium]|nr:type secretion system family protein [Hyphomicrobiales bacterium]